MSQPTPQERSRHSTSHDYVLPDEDYAMDDYVKPDGGIFGEKAINTADKYIKIKPSNEFACRLNQGASINNGICLKHPVGSSLTPITPDCQIHAQYVNGQAKYYSNDIDYSTDLHCHTSEHSNSNDENWYSNYQYCYSIDPCNQSKDHYDYPIDYKGYKYKISSSSMEVPVPGLYTQRNSELWNLYHSNNRSMILEARPVIPDTQMATQYTDAYGYEVIRNDMKAINRKHDSHDKVEHNIQLQEIDVQNSKTANHAADQDATIHIVCTCKVTKQKLIVTIAVVVLLSMTGVFLGWFLNKTNATHMSTTITPTNNDTFTSITALSKIITPNTSSKSPKITKSSPISSTTSQMITSSLIESRNTTKSTPTLTTPQTINTSLIESQNTTKSTPTLTTSQKTTSESSLPTFKGHRYHISSPQYLRPDQANITCNQQGGYLLEINDMEEFDFIKGELLTETDFLVPLGVIRSSSLDTWRYATTSDDVTYFQWGPGEPDINCNECECMMIGLRHRSSTGWRMYDTH